jgi:hypothetical protein
MELGWRTFATDGDLGGSDGFLRVPPNYANRKLLETLSTRNASRSSRPDLPGPVLVGQRGIWLPESDNRPPNTL